MKYRVRHYRNNNFLLQYISCRLRMDSVLVPSLRGLFFYPRDFFYYFHESRAAMEGLPEVKTKSEKLIYDRFYTYLRQKYEPLIKKVNEDFKGDRLRTEFSLLEEKKKAEILELQGLLSKYFVKLTVAIQNGAPKVGFTFHNNKFNSNDELMFGIFTSIVELKGYEIVVTKGVDTDSFMDYYEPYTTHTISLV